MKKTEKIAIISQPIFTRSKDFPILIPGFFFLTVSRTEETRIDAELPVFGPGPLDMTYLPIVYTVTPDKCAESGYKCSIDYDKEKVHPELQIESNRVFKARHAKGINKTSRYAKIEIIKYNS